MTTFEWNSNLELGHPEIDEQHMRLFLLAGAVVESMTDSDLHRVSVDAAPLHALVEFAVEHFAFEESLMLSVGYPESEWHAKYHASLLDELRRFSYQVQQGQNTNAASLIGFLRDWLTLHIDSIDRELVVWLMSHETKKVVDGAT